MAVYLRSATVHLVGSGPAPKARGRWGFGVLDYGGKPERQLCRLFLSLMDKMDQHPERFGDATGMLEEV